jgi:hypothetical protein
MCRPLPLALTGMATDTKVRGFALLRIDSLAKKRDCFLLKKGFKNPVKI